jgi:hypothetical protein
MAPHFEDFKKYAHGSSMLMEYQQVWSWNLPTFTHLV